VTYVVLLPIQVDGCAQSQNLSGLLGYFLDFSNISLIITWFILQRTNKNFELIKLAPAEDSDLN
jgi:hypothetical protein